MNNDVFWDTWERLRAHDWVALSNGKAHRVTRLARGAGALAGHVLVTYRCRESGETFVRDLSEWADHMEPAPETPPLWSRRAPTYEAMLALGMRCMDERHFWVRGWDFNRPVIMCVTMGMRRKTDGGPLVPELNYQLLRAWPGVTNEPRWESEFLPALEKEAELRAAGGLRMLGRGWRPLEWGPEIVEPLDETKRTIQ